jgi:hypothetical protein
VTKRRLEVTNGLSNFWKSLVYVRKSLRIKLSMRKLFVTVILLFAFIVIASSGGSMFAGVAKRLALYVNIARLYTREPDKQLSMPIPGVSKKGIASTWHAARSPNRKHEGQDIFAPRGTPIYSATEGYVVNVGENALGGQTVSVMGAGGRVYYYAHLDDYAPNLSVGDYVTPETELGYVGSTGNAVGTPPHLHFGVYTSAGAIDPLPLLTDRPQPGMKSTSDVKHSIGTRSEATASIPRPRR